jgi:4-hydroxythreonine-4-phosphate dehydrogenase
MQLTGPLQGSARRKFDRALYKIDIMNQLPRLLITLGDVAGIGPEVVVKAWADLQAICRPIVIGDLGWMRQAAKFAQPASTVMPIERIDGAQPSARHIPCWQGTMQNLDHVAIGKVSAAAGRAAYDFLCTAMDLTMARQADGIVTLPLHKEGLHAAGLHYPGHTEILAERTGVEQFGMMLYAPPGPNVANGIGVVHVTLHMALHDVFRHITTAAVLEKIHLLNDVMRKLCGRVPRLAVAALNPHASDGGLFGNEEARILLPAVQAAAQEGIDVAGPLPSDTLFVLAQRGKFDGVVAMYHDQGHIALKLLTGLAAVNVTLGLPIVRTSVAHGTAYDIAGQGKADPRSLLEAARVAAALVAV